MTRWASDKLAYIKNRYFEDYKKWLSDDIEDDREIFCSLYVMLWGAVNAVRDVENTVVCVAMDKKIKDEMAMMDLIQKRFSGK